MSAKDCMYQGGLVFFVDCVLDFVPGEEIHPCIEISLGKVRKRTSKVDKITENAVLFQEYLFFRAVDFKKLVEEKEVEDIEFQFINKGETEDEEIASCKIPLKSLFLEKINYKVLEFEPEERGSLMIDCVVLHTHKDALNLFAKHCLKSDYPDDIDFFFQRKPFDISMVPHKVISIKGPASLNWRVYDGVEVEEDEKKFRDLDWEIEFLCSDGKNGTVRGDYTTTTKGISFSNINVENRYVIFGQLRESRNLDIVLLHFIKGVYTGTYRITGELNGSSFKGKWRLLNLIKRNNFQNDVAACTGKVKTTKVCDE